MAFGSFQIEKAVGGAITIASPEDWKRVIAEQSAEWGYSTERTEEALLGANLVGLDDGKVVFSLSPATRGKTTLGEWMWCGAC